MMFTRNRQRQKMPTLSVISVSSCSTKQTEWKGVQGSAGPSDVPCRILPHVPARYFPRGSSAPKAIIRPLRAEDVGAAQEGLLKGHLLPIMVTRNEVTIKALVRNMVRNVMGLKPHSMRHEIEIELVVPGKRTAIFILHQEKDVIHQFDVFGGEHIDPQYHRVEHEGVILCEHHFGAWSVSGLCVFRASVAADLKEVVGDYYTSVEVPHTRCGGGHVVANDVVQLLWKLVE